MRQDPGEIGVRSASRSFSGGDGAVEHECAHRCLGIFGGYGQKLVLVGSSSDRQPFIFRCFVFFDSLSYRSSASSIGLIMYQQKVYIKCWRM